MFRRATLPRSRHTAVRLVLLVALSVSTFSVLYYCNSVHPFSLIASQGHSGIVRPFDRPNSLRGRRGRLGEDEDGDDGLVVDGVTIDPRSVSTISFDIEGQIAQDTLEFSEELKALGFDAVEDENRHIGVEKTEREEWEEQLAELEDAADDESLGLVEDDHVPGLVEDVRPQAGHRGHHHQVGWTGRKDSLMEDELEAVARLAEEDAMRDAEDQEWSKLGDVEESKEWKKEANVDWEEEEANIERDMDEEEEKIRQKNQKKQKQRAKKLKQKEHLSEDEDDEDEEYDENEEEDDEQMGNFISSTVDYTGSTTFETSTIEPGEEVAREEEEEKEIFNAPETRLISRLLLKLGLDGKNRRFRTALETHASKDKKILLTLSDSRYTMLVLNFYESMVLKRGIENVLFGSLDGKLCAKLDALRIPCFVYAWDTVSDDDVKAGIRRIFNRKVYYRSRMILEAIAMGYTVLYSDVDTMYMRDPFDDMEDMCDGCDVAFQQFTSWKRKLSWGVNYVRPTIGSLYLYYSIARKSYNRSTISMPDRFINRLDREGKLSIVRLPHMKCRSGIEFFEEYKFGWEHRCRGCVSIHSDEYYSKEAKMYRLKELLLWNLNVDKYYSSRTRKYIQYDNPYIFHNSTETLIMEMKALRNALALGQILQRIVVLPRFHCFVPVAREGEPVPPEMPRAKWCNLHDVLRIEPFHRWFMGRYREHSFLTHPKVPRVVKKNVSEVFYIGQKIPQDPGPDGESVIAANVTLIRPRSPLYGAQSEEIRSLFEHETAPVLRFHSLYYGFSHFLSDEVARAFNRRIKLGFDFRKRVHYTVRKLKVKKPVKPDTQPVVQYIAPPPPHRSPPGHPPNRPGAYHAPGAQIPAHHPSQDLQEEQGLAQMDSHVVHEADDGHTFAGAQGHHHHQHGDQSDHTLNKHGAKHSPHRGELQEDFMDDTGMSPDEEMFMPPNTALGSANVVVGDYR